MSAYIPAKLREADCPICGKHFVPAAQNVYKIRVRVGRRGYTTLDCCSYTCYRQHQKNVEAAKEKKRIESERKRKERQAKHLEEWKNRQKSEYDKGADTDAADNSQRVFATD